MSSNAGCRHRAWQDARQSVEKSIANYRIARHFRLRAVARGCSQRPASKSSVTSSLFVHDADAPLVGGHRFEWQKHGHDAAFADVRCRRRQRPGWWQISANRRSICSSTTHPILHSRAVEFSVAANRDRCRKVAVLLNISPDHLDWHASEEEYRRPSTGFSMKRKAVVVNRADEDAPRQGLAKGMFRIFQFRVGRTRRSIWTGQRGRRGFPGPR